MSGLERLWIKGERDSGSRLHRFFKCYFSLAQSTHSGPKDREPERLQFLEFELWT